MGHYLTKAWLAKAFGCACTFLVKACRSYPCRSFSHEVCSASRVVCLSFFLTMSLARCWVFLLLVSFGLHRQVHFFCFLSLLHGGALSFCSVGRCWAWICESKLLTLVVALPVFQCFLSLWLCFAADRCTAFLLGWMALWVKQLLCLLSILSFCHGFYEGFANLWFNKCWLCLHSRSKGFKFVEFGYLC